MAARLPERLPERLGRALTPAEDDILTALAEMAGNLNVPDHRYGLSWMHDVGPVRNAGWYAWASLNGHRITTATTYWAPGPAFEELAGHLVVWHTCPHCGRDAYPYPGEEDRCHWRRTGATWQPGCTTADDPEPTQHGAASA